MMKEQPINILDSSANISPIDLSSIFVVVVVVVVV